MKFTESPYFILKQYFEDCKSTGASNSSITNSSLTGLNRTIVAQGGKYTPLYVKIEEEDSHEDEYYDGFETSYIGFKFLALDDILSEDYFRFYKNDLVTKNVSSQDSPDFDNGSSVYFRKDSYFHTWLKNNTTLYGDYINPNIEWLYFGKIYLTSSGYYRIVYDGLKNFALRALPEHNRTDTVKDLFDVFFDKIYNIPYTGTKDLLTLLDAFEIDEDFLYYLAEMYSIDIPTIFNEQTKREFVSNIIYMLKRKGTYSSLYLIWQLFLGNTLNKLNVYERWHSPNISVLSYVDTGDSAVLNSTMNMYNPSGSTYTVYSCSGRNADIVGDELVVNGTFSIGISGWREGRDAIADAVESSKGPSDYCLLLKNGFDTQKNSDYGFVVQTVPVTAGDTYYFSCYSWASNDTSASIHIGDHYTKNKYLNEANGVIDTWTLTDGYFKPDDNYIQIVLQNMNKTEHGQTWYDTVSLKRVEPLNCDYAFQGNNVLTYICSGSYAPIISNELIANGQFDETGNYEGWSPINTSISYGGNLSVSDDYLRITQGLAASAGSYTGAYQIVNNDSGTLYRFSCETRAETSGAVYVGTEDNSSEYLTFTAAGSAWASHSWYFYSIDNTPIYIRLINLDEFDTSTFDIRKVSLFEAEPLDCDNALDNGIWCSGGVYSYEPTGSCATLWTSANIFDQTGIGTCTGGIYIAEVPPSASCGDSVVDPDSEATSGSHGHYTRSMGTSAEYGYISPSAWNESFGYVARVPDVGVSDAAMLLTGLESEVPDPEKTLTDTASAHTYQDFQLSVPLIYKLSGSVKKKTGESYQVILYDVTNSREVYDTGAVSVTGSNWDTFSHSFTCSAGMQDFRLNLYSLTPSGVYFDNVSIYEQDESYTYDTPITHFIDVLHEITYGVDPEGCAGDYWYNRAYTIPESYVHTQLEESKSWTISHEMYTRYIHVHTYEYNSLTEKYDLVKPKQIYISDYGTVEILFEEAVRGVAILVAGKYIKSQTSPTTSWMILHGQEKHISDYINSYYYYERPKSISTATQGRTVAQWNEALAGYGYATSAAVINPVYSYVSGEHQAKITHNRGQNVLIHFFDENDDFIVPETLTLQSTSAAIATFSYPVTSGEYAIVKEPVAASASALQDYDVDTGMIVSPHYRVELDLSCEPLNSDYIIDEDTMDWLMWGWELMRPVSRVAHYHQLLSPITDFTRNWRPLYDQRLYEGYCMSTFCATAGTPDVWNEMMAFFQNTNRKRWWINHSRSSKDWIVQCYDKDWKRIWPDAIEVRSNNDLILDFDSAINGYAFLVETDTSTSGASLTHSSPSATWLVTHNLDDSTPSAGSLSQYDGAPIGDRPKIVPSNIQIIDKDSILVTFGTTEITGKSQTTLKEYYHEQSSSATTWVVDHSLDERGLIVQVFDENDNSIVPASVLIQDKNTCILTFPTSINGYAIVRSVPYSLIESEVINSIAYWKIGTSEIDPYTNEDLGTPATSGSSFTVEEDGDYYYILIDVRKKFTGNITEIGLFNANHEMLFYSKFSPLYNPDNVIFSIFYRIEKQK